MTKPRAALLISTCLIAAFASPTPSHADDVRDKQWHLQFLNITAAHELSQGNGVLVAIADTGVDPRAAEMSPAVVPGITTTQTEPEDGRVDTNGHGTAMAALVAARGKGDGDGVLGIAPRSTILPVRVALAGVMGSPPDLGAGIAWAASHGAKVISVSFSTSEDRSLKEAIDKALAADVVLVAGVGNAPADKRVAYPARHPGVLAVGGVDREGNHAAISVTGPEVMIAAPAVDIMSIGASQRYRTATGTSDATAIVAGAVALVRAKYPQLTGPEVIRRLTLTAQDRGAPGRDEQYGYGVLDIVKALTADIPPASPTMSPPPPNAEEQGKENGTVVVAAIGVAALVVVAVVVIQGLIRSRRRRYR